MEREPGSVQQEIRGCEGNPDAETDPPAEEKVPLK